MNSPWLPRPGRYRHYKGNEYTLLEVARHSETQEQMAVYQPEYGERGWWVRPLEMFCEYIEVKQQIVRRFQCIEPPLDWADTCEIRRATEKDADAIREIHEQAFGRPEEAKLVDSLTKGPWTVLSLIVADDGRPIAHLLLTRLEIVTGGLSVPSLAMAPVSVLPAYQRKGIGSRMIMAAMDLARGMGEQTVFVLGEPEYYGRFGFQHEATHQLTCEYQCDAWMAVALSARALDGVEGEVRYAPPFRDDLSDSQS